MSGINDLAEERGLLMAAAYLESVAADDDFSDGADYAQILRELTPQQKLVLRNMVVEQQRAKHFVE